ncbi:GtrA family protein [Marinobacterium sp. LSUCC0821]|uniref:GtrA family protein n=1 Tax=Marinobacterium sp. LSUCC0821 TaxID=2668067 RepID=UPI001451E6DB|nr:GtrA family protein [Marinobacterium sp. LSUCC0821]QJD71083.1 GtrA family protein [Marinobacterium sp. LSUCC0821]
MGLIATGVHALVYGILGWYMEPMLANLIAFLIAFFFSYSGHFFWTFRIQTQGEKIHKAFNYQFRFLVVALSGLLLNSFAVWVVTGVLQVDYLFAVVPMIFVVPLLTFVLARLWVFR